MSVMLCPCIFCVALLIDLIVLFVACLTGFVSVYVDTLVESGLVSTSPAFMRSIASPPADLHGWLAKKR